MAHTINHVHIRSADPRASASWYEMHFGAKIVSEREVMPGTVTISMQMGGQCGSMSRLSPKGPATRGP
jgi:predicted enzyme related to lactoylglutathione lyase